MVLEWISGGTSDLSPFFPVPRGLSPGWVSNVSALSVFRSSA